MENKPLYERIAEKIHGEPTPLRDIYPMFPEYAEETVRARIYEHLGEVFERLDRGVYIAKIGDSDVAVIKGDAWEEIENLKSESFDAIITDPPYPWLDHHVETGTTRKESGELSFETRDLDGEILSEFYRVLKDGAHCLIFVPSLSGDTLEPVIGLVRKAENEGLEFNKYFVWDKEKIGMGYNGRCRYEGVLFLSKGERRMPVDRSVPDLIPVERISPSDRGHETEKPVALLKQLVLFSTEEEETILDPFAGSGSTGVACAELNRNCVLVEIKEEFVEHLILPRLSQAEGSAKQRSLGTF